MTIASILKVKVLHGGQVKLEGGEEHHNASIVAKGYPDRYTRWNHEVEFSNEAGEPVTVVIPLDPMAPDILSERKFRLEDGKSKVLGVKDGQGHATYRFCVLMETLDEYAVMASTPKMMIEPPGEDPPPGVL